LTALQPQEAEAALANAPAARPEEEEARLEEAAAHSLARAFLSGDRAVSPHGAARVPFLPRARVQHWVAGPVPSQRRMKELPPGT